MTTPPPSFGSGSSTGDVGSSVSLAPTPGGYLDSAIPETMFRLRFDAASGMNSFDRAEYYFASWRELSFHIHGINGGGLFFDKTARGTPLFVGDINWQEASGYLEYAFTKRFSMFINVPYKAVQFRNVKNDDLGEAASPPSPIPVQKLFPEPDGDDPENPDSTANQDSNGLGDISVGFKFALIASPDQYFTFQYTLTAPTGNALTGLGNGLTSMQPEFLYYKRLNNGLEFQGQFGDWIPVGAGPGAGNILIYGLGLGYDVYTRGNLRIVPVTEFVGWTCLSGVESVVQPMSINIPAGYEVPDNHGVKDAAGETIVNGKIGVRTYFGEGNNVYFGYGHALTGDRWYKDIVRVEYCHAF
jgi:hypothetical protein